MKLTMFNPELCNRFNPDSNFTQCHYYIPSRNGDKECGYCKIDDKFRCLAVDLPIPLSNSSVGNFLTCHQLYFLQTMMGISTRNASVSIPLKIGKLWDSALQYIISGKIIDITGNSTSLNDIIEEYEINEFDVAKVRALYRAYKELEIEVEPNFNLQAKANLTYQINENNELIVDGYYDRKYDNYFVENKLSGHPENYLDIWFIQSQMGTYFLADPKLEYCIMEVTRVPALRRTGKNANDTADEFEDRIFQDILSRPSFYFLGWDSKKKTYGKKFFRNEFDLKEIELRYKSVAREIKDARINKGFYCNDRVCSNIFPGIPCGMLPICRSGNMSEQIYKIRSKPVTKQD